MAELKRRTLILCTGKQIRLYGNSIAIGPSREIGEGAAPNIFSELISPSIAKTSGEKIEPPEQISEQSLEGLEDSKTTETKTKKKKSSPREIIKPEARVSNPYQLTVEELHDLADYNIQLWMDLKKTIRRYGVSDSKIFNQET